MDIRYSEKAEKQIKKIHKGDKKSAAMIMEAIENFAAYSSGKKNMTLKSLKENMEISKDCALETTASYSRTMER